MQGTRSSSARISSMLRYLDDIVTQFSQLRRCAVATLERRVQYLLDNRRIHCNKLKLHLLLAYKITQTVEHYNERLQIMIASARLTPEQQFV